MAEDNIIPAGAVITLPDHFDEQGKPFEIKISEPISESSFRTQLEGLMKNFQQPAQAAPPVQEQPAGATMAPIGSDTRPVANEGQKYEQVGTAETKVPVAEKPVEEPKPVEPTVSAELAPTIRGIGPTAGMALAGAALAPIAGVSLATGAVTMAGLYAASELIAEPLIHVVNQKFGTRITTPSEAWGMLFDQLGVPRSSTEAAKIAEAVMHGVAGAAGWSGLGKSIAAAGEAHGAFQGGGLAREATRQSARAASMGEAAAAGSPELEFATQATYAPQELGQSVAGYIGKETPELGYAAQRALGGGVQQALPGGVSAAQQAAQQTAQQATSQAARSFAQAAAPYRAPFDWTAVGNEMAANAGTNMIAGGAAGGFGEASRGAAEKLGLGEKGQTAAAVIGSVIGGGLASSAASISGFAKKVPGVAGMTPQQVEQTLAEADAAGRRIFTSDLFRPKTKKMQLAQEASEGLAFGTAATRYAQEVERKGVIHDFLSSNGVTIGDSALNDVAASLKRTRSENVRGLSTVKNNIISKANSAGGGVMPDQISRALGEIDAQIAALNGINSSEFAPIVNRLNSFRNGLVDASMDANGNLIYSSKTLGQIDANLKLIGESIPRDQSIANLAKNPNVDAAFKSIYRALRKDIGEYIYTNLGRQEMTDWAKANIALSDSARELNKSTLKSVLKTLDATPENVARLLDSQKASDIQALMRNLDATGKRAVKVAVLEKVAAKSLDGKTQEIVPNRFLANAVKESKKIGLTLSPQDQKELDGLLKYLNLTTRAGEFNVNPPTGARNFLPLLYTTFGTFFNNPIVASALASSIGMGAHIFESKAVRNALINFSNVNANSQAGVVAANRLREVMTNSAFDFIQKNSVEIPLTFQPGSVTESSFQNGMVTTDNQLGYRMLERNKKIHLFGPDDAQIGIYDSKKEAQGAANRNYIKKNRPK